jgi:hypothetical protein
MQISMDGNACWRDDVFVERLWRSVKYQVLKDEVVKDEVVKDEVVKDGVVYLHGTRRSPLSVPA